MEAAARLWGKRWTVQSTTRGEKKTTGAQNIKRIPLPYLFSKLNITAVYQRVLYEKKHLMWKKNKYFQVTEKTTLEWWHPSALQWSIWIFLQNQNNVLFLSCYKVVRNQGLIMPWMHNPPCTWFLSTSCMEDMKRQIIPQMYRFLKNLLCSLKTKNLSI